MTRTNGIEYSYTPDGKLAGVSRRASGSSRSEPMTRLEYDSKRNVSAVMRLDAKGEAVVTTRFQNNAAGQAEKISDGRTATTVTYTPQGFPASVADTFGQVTRIAYDRYNRCVGVLAPTGAKTEITYDADGRVAAIARSFNGRASASARVAYDANGRAVSYTDHRNRVKRFEHDGLGRVAKEIFPDDSEVAYSFSSLGRLSQVIDQNGNAISFEWGNFGIKSKATAAGQLTDYTYDANGRVTRIDSKSADTKIIDRSIALTYDKLDRVASVKYGDGQERSTDYDAWGRVARMSNHGVKTELKYDYFGCLIEKREGKTTETYVYNNYRQRVMRETKTPDGVFFEKREYDKFGRLSKIIGADGEVAYAYDAKNRVAGQTANGARITFKYTPEGWLDSKTMHDDNSQLVATLKYVYAPDGQIAGRIVDGERHEYKYDAKDQLLAVLDAQGEKIESYTYDPAGNMLEKTINGATTVYTYDAANQLVLSTDKDGIATPYEYDAAGRLVKEGGKTYRYGWMDKVLGVSENGKETATFDYHASGQIAKAAYADRTETFLWDGLALIRRNGMNFINEPHAGGGAPVLAGGNVMFNDLLGSTLGVSGMDGYKTVTRSAFGEVDKNSAGEEFFTGKPNVEGLGYAFLLRNYRASHAKWQTSDPLGYPDGWNNLAYGNNRAINGVDLFGGKWSDLTFVLFYYLGGGEYVDTDDMGLTGDIWNIIQGEPFQDIEQNIDRLVESLVKGANSTWGVNITSYTFPKTAYEFGSIVWAMGLGLVSGSFTIDYSWSGVESEDGLDIVFSWSAVGDIEYEDEFKEPLHIGGRGTKWEPFGIPYKYGHAFRNIQLHGSGIIKLGE